MVGNLGRMAVDSMVGVESMADGCTVDIDGALYCSCCGGCADTALDCSPYNSSIPRNLLDGGSSCFVGDSMVRFYIVLAIILLELGAVAVDEVVGLDVLGLVGFVAEEAVRLDVLLGLDSLADRALCWLVLAFQFL